jgi:hypothetical protein
MNTEQPTQAGPPEGYVPCREKCGRYAKPDGADDRCARCASGGEQVLYDAIVGLYGPDWQPTIAPPTPAPAREIRVGQRWRVTYAKRKNYQTPPAVIELTDRRKEGWECRNVENASFPGWINDSHWTEDNDQGATMTLLSDAPATSEPGRACGCKGTHDARQCPPAHATIDDCIDAQNAARPPQEAAKAPVCCGPLHACSGPLLERVVGAVSGVMCESWMFRLESIVTRATPASGEPYTGPSRLPRPRLTHSAMWADFAEDVS